MYRAGTFALCLTLGFLVLFFITPVWLALVVEFVVVFLVAFLLAYFEPFDKEE